MPFQPQPSFSRSLRLFLIHRCSLHFSFPAYCSKLEIYPFSPLCFYSTTCLNSRWTYCGWTNSCTTLKPLETTIGWFLQGESYHSRGFLGWCEMDVVHLQETGDVCVSRALVLVFEAADAGKPPCAARCCPWRPTSPPAWRCCWQAGRGAWAALLTSSAWALTRPIWEQPDHNSPNLVVWQKLQVSGKYKVGTFLGHSTHEASLSGLSGVWLRSVSFPPLVFAIWDFGEPVIFLGGGRLNDHHRAWSGCT